MKTLRFACRLGAALAILLVGDRALAQGCNLGVVPADDPPSCNWSAHS
jgi:hypothetical protein